MTRTMTDNDRQILDFLREWVRQPIEQGDDPRDGGYALSFDALAGNSNDDYALTTFADLLVQLETEYRQREEVGRILDREEARWAVH